MTPAKPDSRHVVIDSSVVPPVMRCLHCGETALVRQPAPVSIFSKRCHAFIQLHEDCPKPQ